MADTPDAAAPRPAAPLPQAPASSSPSSAPPAAGTSGLTADEENKLIELIAKRDAADRGDQPAVNLKVEPPHESMTFGGYTVTDEFRPFSEQAYSAIMTAASDAGVTITRES